MEILRGNYGEVRICDCMDFDYGMGVFEDAVWSHCISDPPYGQKTQHHDGKVGGTTTHAKAKVFPKINDEKFTVDQFTEIQRISRDQILFGGNYFEFLPHTDCWWIWDKRCKNNQACDQADGEMALTSFKSSVRIFHHLWKGFLCNETRVHPFQKPKALWDWLFAKLHPISVLDPFMGSGITARKCEELGIDYIGYEIMPTNIPLIQHNIDSGMKDHKIKQLTLFS